MGFSFLVLGKVGQAEAEIHFVKKIKGVYDMRSRAGFLRGGESGDPFLIPCANIRVGGEVREEPHRVHTPLRCSHPGKLDFSA